jgi:glycosyltransferase involved in cell wall biosynthesis/SAM-dependent methyltransferase
MPPALSVCVPTWNGATYVAETLRSVLAQTFTDFELLIVDDGSTDATLNIVASFADPRVRVHQNARRLGLAGNWNRCLELAQGRYVKFLFQDDTLEPDAVAVLFATLEAAPLSPLAFGRRQIRYHGPGLEDFPLQGGYYDEVLDGFYRSFAGSVTGVELVTQALREGRDLAVNVIGEPSFVLLRRQAVLEAGGFDPGFVQLPDWELWLRLARRGPLVFVDHRLGVFRVHVHGASMAGLARVPWENVKLLDRLRRVYGPVLEPDVRRRLRQAEWRHFVHFVGRSWPGRRLQGRVPDPQAKLIPPQGSIFVGEGDFTKIGEEFLRYFIDLGGLAPHHRVLDVGCGIGRMAVPLTRYLDERGRYDGFDVVAKGIDWCRSEISPRFPRFRFHLADVRNRFYNPGARGEATRYSFPYADRSFDFVILTSVFTHMLPEEMESYLSEVSRVVKPDGTVFLTFFLVTPEIQTVVESGGGTLDFRYDGGHFRTVDEATPERAVAYSEAHVRERFSAHGLFVVEPVRYGTWSGRRGGLSYQDVVVTRRSR